MATLDDLALVAVAASTHARTSHKREVFLLVGLAALILAGEEDEAKELERARVKVSVSSNGSLIR